MSAPTQLQIRYLAEEDRILMRMNTLDEEEYRFWLTRRFCLRLWPVLQEALFSTPTVTQQMSLSARHAMVAFEHEAAQSKAEFNTQFRESKHFPLGADPLLIVHASFNRHNNGTYALTLQNTAKKGINITLTNDLLHLMCKLLEDAAGESDWEIPPLIQNTHLSLTPSERQLLN